MYRRKIIQPGQPGHSGQNNLPEVQIFHNYEKVDTLKGPTATMKSTKYITDHAWAVRQNEFGLQELAA